MKTLHLLTIIGSAILVAVIFTLMILEQNFLPSGNFHITKIQKLTDDTKIWKLIHPINGEREEYVSTEGMDWSYDGRFLAFGVNAGAPVSYLWTMDVTGERLVPINIPIEFNSISYVHISKNRNSIFFVGQYNSNNDTYQDIFRYDVNDKTYSFVTKDSHVRSVGFMQDGNILYVESHSNSTRLEKNKPIFLIRNYNVLWMATSDGHKIKPIYNGTQLFDGITVNPDGNSIAFVSRDDPLHPSSNGTDIVNLSLMGGPPTINNYSYFAIFEVNTKEFTVTEKVNNEDFTSIKWLPDGDHILYEKMTHHCVQDKLPGMQSCPAGLLELMTVSGHSFQVIYGNQAEPYTAPLVGVIISPDGRSIIFGMNYDYSNGDIDGKGIYQMVFDKPLFK